MSINPNTHLNYTRTINPISPPSDTPNTTTHTLAAASLNYLTATIHAILTNPNYVAAKVPTIPIPAVDVISVSGDLYLSAAQLSTYSEILKQIAAHMVANYTTYLVAALDRSPTTAPAAFHQLFELDFADQHQLVTYSPDTKYGFYNYLKQNADQYWSHTLPESSWIDIIRNQAFPEYAAHELYRLQKAAAVPSPKPLVSSTTLAAGKSIIRINMDAAAAQAQSKVLPKDGSRPARLQLIADRDYYMELSSLQTQQENKKLFSYLIYSQQK